MKLDRVQRNIEPPRNPLVGHAFGKGGEHFEFARRQQRVTLALAHRGKTIACDRRAHDEAGGDRADRRVDLARVGLARQRAAQAVVGDTKPLDTKPDDVARIFRRPAAVGEHDIRRIVRVDNHVACFSDGLAKEVAAMRVIRVNGDPQSLRKYDIVRHFVHAACRSAMVVWTVITAPPRIRRTSALRPMLSLPKYRASFLKRCADMPSTLRMMSPATIPACAAGPLSTTDITIIPPF